MELTALSAALRRHIRVHALGMDAINLGERGEGACLISDVSVKCCLQCKEAMGW